MGRTVTTAGEAELQPRRRRGYGSLLLGATLLVLGVLTRKIFFRAANDLRVPESQVHRLSTNSPFQLFDWNSIKPAKELEYHACFDGYLCARLLVPLDWTTSPLDWNRTAALAIIKLPANVSILDPSYGGEIYLNPGGPGGSGTRFLPREAHDLRTVIQGGDATFVSGDERKVFDLVSFDPRGVARSTPTMSCFNSLMARQLWQQTGWAHGLADRSLEARRSLWARAEALGRKCAIEDKNSDERMINNHMSTTAVARDMVEILERAGKLREKNARDALRKASTLACTRAAVPDNLRYRPGKETLKYWGFSYGTSIGGYFAAMYPQRVERMILDGSNNFDTWAESAGTTFLTDTDKAFQKLFDSCFAAGPDRCPLFAPDGPTVMKERVLEFIESLSQAPLAVWEPSLPIPEVLTRDAMVSTIFNSLYNPYARFPTLARQLAELMSGNLSSAKEFLPSRNIFCSEEQCRREGCDVDLFLHLEWNSAVQCSDGVDLRGGTFEDYEAWTQILMNQTSLFAGMGATYGRIDCYFWPHRPKERFGGPFGGNTLHPILWAATMADPVCPVGNAFAMGDKYTGARVLVQDSAGHTSTSAPSLCTMKHIRQYFQTGVLPPNGTVCGVDRQIFDEVKSLGDLVQEDRELSLAGESLASSRSSVFY